MTDIRRAAEAPRETEGQAQIRNALAGLRFGSVEITVHEGRIVQVERREKVRLAPEGSAGKR